jgi:protein-S-isoprenylcysteine O-methyltransferase Ste14
LWLDLAATLTPYFESHAVGTIWIVACIATAIAEATGMFRYRAGANKRDGGSGLVLRLIMIPAIASVILSPQVAPGAAIHPPLTSFIIGTFIFTAGEALRIWSRVTLGRYFTYAVQTSSDQPVIQTGPYRVLRHPSYAGILLIVIGFGCVWGNWLGLAIGTLLTFIGLSYRIRVEELALAAELGDAYSDYAKTHQRLIPYLW